MKFVENNIEVELVTRTSDNGVTMYNATRLLKAAPNKRMSDFIKLKGTKGLVNNLLLNHGCKEDILTIVQTSAQDKSTWMCEELLQQFVRWSSAGLYKQIMNYLATSEVVVVTTRAEASFGKDIVESLFADYTVVPQYPVFDGKYRIDWYIPELKIAVEFDEDQHKTGKMVKEDARRQREIEKELGCTFIRRSYKS